MLDLIERKAVTNYLAAELDKLAHAGATFGALAANTAHIVFDDLRRMSPIPLVSLMETTCSEAQSLGLTKLGLFGTRFTMQAQFYPDAFTKSGIVIVVPHLDEQILIHERYTGELLPGVFRSETRKLFLNMVDPLNRREDFED